MKSNLQNAGSSPSTSPLLRVWLVTPDWVFRLLGVLFFLAYVAARAPAYFDPRNTGAKIWGLPLPRLLGDLTFVLVAISFAIRVPPRQRAATAAQIVIPLIGGFWPLLPFLLLTVLRLVGSPWAKMLDSSISTGPISLTRSDIAAMTMAIGLAVQVWSYIYLSRSLSIVAEARELVTTGPFCLIRHPIYLGQFLAQAGFWLIFLRWQLHWVVFYFLFVVMQLYRSWIEEKILADAFGEPYLSWKNRTFWFF